MTEQQINDRLAELYAKQKAATGWGAAVGARHEEIKSLEGQLAALQRRSTVTAEAKLADEMQSLGYPEFGDCLSFDAYNLILAALRAASQPVSVAQPPTPWMPSIQRMPHAAQAESMVRLSASEAACYRWPEDTAEHRAMRAAFMDGAASAASIASAEVVQTQDELGALLHAAEAEVEWLRGIAYSSQQSPHDLADKIIADPSILHLRECGFQPAMRFESTLRAAIVRALAIPSTDREAGK